MSESDFVPGRRYPARSEVWDKGNRASLVFVTVCTKDRRPVLANRLFHELIREWWLNSEGWKVGRYVILPDHLHFFCSPDSNASSLSNWIAYWKNGVSRGCSETEPLWQRSFWDRQLRTGDSYAAKWEYIRNNPVRHGFVKRAGDWEFQGELETLSWHEP